MKILWILFFAGFCAAKEPRLTDLSFKIRSDRLKNLFEKKGALKKLNKLHCDVYWLEGRLDVKAVADGMSPELEKVYEKVCRRKSFLALPFDLENYLSPFRKKESKGGWTVYTDAAGTRDINEIMLKTGKNRTLIVEKRPSGTTRLTYTFDKVHGARKVVRSEMSSYEGAQSVKTDTKIIYMKQNGFVLPAEATVSTVQELTRKDSDAYSRKFEENFTFSDYSINASKALLFFSQK